MVQIRTSGMDEVQFARAVKKLRVKLRKEGVPQELRLRAMFPNKKDRARWKRRSAEMRYLKRKAR